MRIFVLTSYFEVVSRRGGGGGGGSKMEVRDGGILVVEVVVSFLLIWSSRNTLSFGNTAYPKLRS